MGNTFLGDVKHKIKFYFEACGWEDSVGRKFKENIIPDLVKSVNGIDENIEIMQKVFRQTEELLKETKVLQQKAKSTEGA